MKNITFISLIIILTSCKKENQYIDKTTLSKIFYDFDKVEYYNLNITNKEVGKLSNSLVEGDILSKKDSLNESIYMFVTNINPKTINEKEINEIISSLKGQKESINSKYFNLLKSKIFIEKKCSLNEHIIPSIMPLYDNIFIFWKKNKMIGLVKLNSNGPFMHIFRGTDRNTLCFGKNGEIDYLRKIIKTKAFLTFKK